MEKKIKNILVTGGAGFIGIHLSLELVQRGYQVTVLDCLSEQVHGQNPVWPAALKDQVTCLRGDVRNKSDWQHALKNQDAVIHLAAETGTGQSMYEVHRYVDVNIGGTALLLDYLVNENHGIQKVMVASSRAVYGEGKYECVAHGIQYPKERHECDLLKGDFELHCPLCSSIMQYLPTDEESMIHPISVYGITKHNQEHMMMQVCSSIDLPAVVFRYQNVYGPGQSLKNPYTGILSIFSTQIKNGHDLQIFEDGKECRDFVYIDDVVRATVLGLEKSEANFGVFNVGSGRATTVFGIAETLKKAYQADVDITITQHFRKGDIRHHVADLQRATEVLGYTPQVSFEDGIALFVRWVNQQEIEQDGHEKSMALMKEKGLYK